MNKFLIALLFGISFTLLASPADAHIIRHRFSRHAEVEIEAGGVTFRFAPFKRCGHRHIHFLRFRGCGCN